MEFLQPANPMSYNFLSICLVINRNKRIHSKIIANAVAIIVVSFVCGAVKGFPNLIQDTMIHIIKKRLKNV